jgi:hypothetical protein
MTVNDFGGIRFREPQTTKFRYILHIIRKNSLFFSIFSGLKLAKLAGWNKKIVYTTRGGRVNHFLMTL